MVRIRTVAVVGLLAGLTCLTVIGMQGCTASDPWAGKAGTRIVVSFPPLYSFTRAVVGDDASVICLLSKDGPHEYDLSPRDVVPLHGANLFLVNGLNLDDFAQKLQKTARNPKLRMVEVGELAIPKDKLRRVSKEEVEAAGHSHGEYDPHVWLGLPEAILMVQQIAKEVSTADPEHAEAHRRRAEAYVRKLEELQAYGKEKFAGKKDRAFIAFHDSLGYFARSFDLKLAGTIQARANVEPDSGQIAKLVTICQKESVRVITVEPQYPTDTAAKTLVREIKQKGLPEVVEVTVDPLETADLKDVDAGWYERKMRQNIDRLAEKLR